jgi:hypothetical protein
MERFEDAKGHALQEVWSGLVGVNREVIHCMCACMYVRTYVFLYRRSRCEQASYARLDVYACAYTKYVFILIYHIHMEKARMYICVCVFFYVYVCICMCMYM